VPRDLTDRRPEPRGVGIEISGENENFKYLPPRRKRTKIPCFWFDALITIEAPSSTFRLYPERCFLRV